MRVDAAKESLLSRKQKTLLLIVSMAEAWGKDRLDKVCLLHPRLSKTRHPTACSGDYFDGCSLFYQASNYVLKVRYFLDPQFKWVDVVHWITGSMVVYAPQSGDVGDKSWYSDILQNYGVFLLYLGLRW